MEYEIFRVIDMNNTNENSTFSPQIYFDTPSNNITNLNINISSTQKPVLSKYYPILAAELGLSILCSTVLIIVYVIIGEHRTLPGKNVISISLCLIMTYILLMIDLLMRNTIPYGICFSIGVMVQTFFLATFFWTNVMSYDIMMTMASVKPDNDKDSKFWKYSIYAWTMTLLCVVPAVAIDHIGFIPADYKPKFGVKKCWLSGQIAFLVYFNAPVGLTLVANCVFFVFTARTIVRVRSATAILAANRHKKRYRLCMKLVLIMGLVWITEFIPLFTGIYWLYAVAGMLNCLHGVYLFIIFACKRRTLKQLAASTCACFAHSAPPVGNRKQSPSLDTVTTTLSD